MQALSAASKGIHRTLEQHPWLYWHLRTSVEMWPALNLFLLRFAYHRLGSSMVERIVSRKTEVVIEGYPRSANSFAHRAFRLAQYQGPKNRPLVKKLFAKKIRIATHVHSPNQLVMGCKLKIPAIALIRRPKDAIKSWKALDMENAIRNKKRDTPLARSDLHHYIRYYIHFYEKIINLRDKYVLARFEDVTRDYGQVIRRLNSKFGTGYRVFEHTKENVQLLFRGSGKHFSPSATRERIKNEIEAEFRKQINNELLADAESVYRRMVSQA